jgi:competence ComEA-like helix-hairpin-helix protein
MIRLIASAVLAVASLFGAAAQQTTPPAPGGTPLPDGPGKPILQRACIGCHSLTTVTSKRASHDEWSETLEKMVSRGADLSDEEIDTLLEYLSANFGPAGSKSEHPASPETTTPPSSPDKTVPPPSSDAASSPASSSAPASLNVNKASAEELQSSLGLSKTEAEAITQYREQHGNFKTWQEVSSVPGVPSKKIEDNQKRLTF